MSVPPYEAAEPRSVLDLFSGTSRVGHAFKKSGYRVTANDHNSYARTLALCYVQADRDVLLPSAERLIAELQKVPPVDGWFTETYARESRFFQSKNAAKVEGIRNRIAELDLCEELRAVALVSLMEAADRVDSTCGVQMAYVKHWAKRSFNDLELRVPDMVAGKGTALQMDAEKLAPALKEMIRQPVELVYLDPPYNQHSYLSNYHIWETLVRWDKPDVYGVAQKRTECREKKSAFNSKRKHGEVFSDLIDALEVPLIMVSFSNEAFLSREELEACLSRRGPTLVHGEAYSRYVGAKIGVHNPQGQRVGEVTHTTNIERLYLTATEHATKEQRAFVAALREPRLEACDDAKASPR